MWRLFLRFSLFFFQKTVIVLIVLGYFQNYMKLGVSPGPQCPLFPMQCLLPTEETSLAGCTRNPSWEKPPNPFYPRTSAASSKLPSTLTYLDPHTTHSPVLWRIPALPLQRSRGLLCSTCARIQSSSLSSMPGLLLPHHISSELGKESASQITVFPLFINHECR